MRKLCRHCLLRRAQQLLPVAAQTPEAVILEAATRLELRHRHHPCPRLRHAIALHYLLLADHPESHAHPRLQSRYRAAALAWIDALEANARQAQTKLALLDS